MIIGTVSTNQHEILRHVLGLYLPEQSTFALDPTYGAGAFYKEIPPPELRFDLYPRTSDVKEADSRDLPLADASVPSIIFDPPFIHAHGKNSIMGQRYGSYHSQKYLREMYHDSLMEFYRVMEPGGILVFKCQDVVESGKQVLTHCYVWQMAEAVGFETLDMFVLVNTNAPLKGWNHTKQYHARKNHCYFFVFRKFGRKKKNHVCTPISLTIDDPHSLVENVEETQ